MFHVFSWNSWLKPWFSNSRDLGGHFRYTRAHETYSRPISWRKRVFFFKKTTNNWMKNRFSPPNIKKRPLTTLGIDRSWNFASIGGMDISVLPNLTALVTNTCKQSVKMKVSNGLRQLPRVYRVFPMVSKDPRGSSKVSEGSQTVSPTLHTCQEKVITAWREKIDDWWVLTIDSSLINDDW